MSAARASTRRIGRVRPGLALALVGLVIWIAVDAAARARTARVDHTRRAIAAAETLVADLIDDPAWPWPPRQTPPPRIPFERAEDYDASLAAAEIARAWRVAENAPPGEVVLTGGDAPWIVQRLPEGVRARPWGPIAERIRERTGVWLVAGGPNAVPFGAGRLTTPEGVAMAVVPTAQRWSWAPWLDVGRVVLALAAAGWLVADQQRTRAAALADRARIEVRDALLQRVSHELRTPAASVLNLAEALRSGAVDDPDERQQFLDLVGSEAARLATGIDRLLRAARGDDPTPLARVRLDLAEWIRTLADRWQPKLTSLSVEAPSALPGSVDPDRLTEAVEALLDNAAKHGGEAVVLSLEARGECAIVAVSDDGPGVDEADRVRIFERLQRVEGRDEDAGGYGLGLWAASEVARAHGGALTLEGRSRFVLTIGRSP